MLKERHDDGVHGPQDEVHDQCDHEDLGQNGGVGPQVDEGAWRSGRQVDHGLGDAGDQLAHGAHEGGRGDVGEVGDGFR